MGCQGSDGGDRTLTFLQTDPIFYADDMNMYAYVGGDPVNGRDPTGKYLEAGFEAVSLTLGVKSLVDNIKEGNVGAAVVDAAGLVVDGVLAAVPVLPGVVGLGIQSGRVAESAVNALKLEKQLASEQQTSKILSGNGDLIAGAGTSKPLRDAPRLEAEYGGSAKDWAKVDGGNHVARDGTKIETHGYENKVTGQIVELKTKLKDEMQ